MKKRLLALALTVALVMAVGIPAFATPIAPIAAPSWYTIASGTALAGVGAGIEQSEYFDVKGSTDKTYTFYGFAKAGATKISWKAIDAKKDLTADGKFNLEKAIGKDAGTLYFVTGSKPTATGTSVPAGVDGITFDIKARVAKVEKTAVTPKYSYDGTNVVASIGSATTLEWTYANAAGSWDAITGTFGVGPTKTDLWVRTAATTENAASPILKVSLAAAKIPTAPKFDLTKGTLAMKVGMEISTNGTTWTTISDTNKVATVNGSDTSLAAAPINININDEVSLLYRIPSTEGTKPGSLVGTIKISAPQNETAIDAENFFLTNKALMVSGETVIEMKVEKGWKKIKSIKAEDIVGKSATVRVPGDKFTLPGDPRTVTVSAAGEISVS